MRVGVKVLRLADRRPGDVSPFAFGADLIKRQRADRILQLRDQPGSFLYPAPVGGKTRVFAERLQAEFLEEALPLLIAGDADEKLTAVLRCEYLVDRPRPLPRRHRRHLAAGRGDARHVGRHQERSTFEQRAADPLATSGRIAL